MATIITKNSQTASAVPAASSLEVGELAVNTADGKLYTEHTGGVVKEIIPSTVVDGGITAAKIASNAVTTAKIADSNVTEGKIADGAVTTNKLSNTGVTAGTYTTATVTVDAKGRITSASTGSGSAPTTAQVLSAMSGITFNSIGGYGFIAYNPAYNSSGVTPNNTYSTGNGVNQVCALIISRDPDMTFMTVTSGTGSISGTWRLLYGVSTFIGSDSYKYGALGVRIA